MDGPARIGNAGERERSGDEDGGDGGGAHGYDSG
jgi:hypothetical protein